MKYFTIMPLNVDHIEEICNDIREQYENGVADCALFKMTLSPEGNPPSDKAGILAEKYVKFQKRLKEMGLKSGILVQATIGHDYVIGEMFPFQRYENLTDGDARNVCCPYDDAFCEHFRSNMQKLAKTNPDIIMVDDDFRLTFRSGRGCACPLHMKKFNAIAGTDISREELYEILRKRDEQSRRYTDIFVKTQEDSLLKAARAMREGIDSINPKIPGAFCGCGGNMEAAADIAKILAGENNPVILRINNASYLTSNTRTFSSSFFRAATQIAHVKDKVDYILDETDTYPQNRYSTSARVLHAHHVGNILEGVCGAKHWITRLQGFEPKSGEYYRKVLCENKGLYQELIKLVPGLSWRGCRIPLSKEPYYDLADAMWDTEAEGWSTHILERYGLPLYFSDENGGIVFLDGKADEKFSDEKIKEFFRGFTVLSSDAAKRLCDRGFSELIGVTVRDWKGLTPCEEWIAFNQSPCSVQTAVKELVPISDEVEIASMVCHTIDKEHYTPLFPGSTVFENELGGTTVVFSGTPSASLSNSYNYSFLTESRKQQFVEILKKSGELPVYYPDDAEIYLRVADMTDGTLFCAVFNFGLDTLDEITLTVERSVESIEMMLSDGTCTSCDFKTDNDRIIIDAKAETLKPVILFLK